MEKISKAQVKFVRSLQLKKVRDAEGLFVAEGEKCVEELRRGFELVYYIQTAEKPQAGPRPATPDRTQTGLRPDRILLATPAEIEQMSSLRTPQGVIGVFRKPVSEAVCQSNGRSVSPKDGQSGKAGLILVLDGVQDPGNLGTIIRTCDWFGVHEIVCSRDTADCYNPKVVQATMGALARVKVRYVDLVEWLEGIRNQESGIRIYGTLLDGKNMYEVLDRTLGTRANEVHADRRAEAGVARQFSGAVLTNASSLPNAIIMGNEGNGISAEVRKFITDPIYIPTYPNKETSDVVESLNVSIATAIVLAEFRRPR